MTHLHFTLEGKEIQNLIDKPVKDDLSKAILITILNQTYGRIGLFWKRHFHLSWLTCFILTSNKGPGELLGDPAINSSHSR